MSFDIDDPIIELKHGKAKFDYSRAKIDKNAKTIKFQFSLGPAHGLIIHPSLCCPSVIKPDEDLEVFLLINQEMVENINSHELIFRRRLLWHLQHNSWNNRCKDGKYNHDFKNPTKDSGPKNFFEQSELEDEDRITYTKPKKLIIGESILLNNNSGDLIGVIKPEVAANYIRDGYDHLLKITVKDHNLAEGMHNLSFVALNKDKNKLTNEDDDIAERQDKLISDSLEKFGTGLNKVYKITEQEPLDFNLNETEDIQSYHPVYVVAKESLGIGHLTDVHISSRQEAFKKCEMQVIPDTDEVISPKIGRKVSSCFDVTRDLMLQIGKRSDVDLLFITGDLVDYSINLDVAGVGDIGNNGIDLWDYLLLYQNSENSQITNKDIKSKTLKPKNKLEATHTVGIDNAIIYSLFLFYYDKFKKPIFITSGNHDAYAMPYGISPRVPGGLALYKGILTTIKDTSEGGLSLFKANATIPMDHNLGFYESILMYGTGYDNILEKNNFSAKKLAWFYNVFTPLSDFAIKYNEQVFIGLEWGEDEDYLKSKVRGSGVLPRAIRTFNSNQLTLIDNACKYGKHRVVFTHAPFVNFDPEIQLVPTSEDSELDLVYKLDGKWGRKLDFGSFKHGKRDYFENYILTNKITHQMSGHSHRSAMYQCVAKKYDGDEIEGFITRGFELVHGEELKVEKVFLRDTKAKYAPEQKIKKSPRFIVTGSGGPISTKNVIGELGGCGLDTPNGTVLTFKGDDDFVECVVAECENSSPAFATLLDSFDINGTSGSMSCFNTSSYVGGQGRDHNYSLQVPDEFKFNVDGELKYLDFIKSFQVLAKAETDLLVDFKVSYDEVSHTYTFYLNPNSADGRDLLSLKSETECYVIIKFKDDIKYIDSLLHYDFSRPWVFKAEIGEKTIGGMHGIIAMTNYIRRHSRYGVEPCFKGVREHYRDDSAGRRL